MYQWKKAKAVWGSNLKNAWNQLLGFYTSVKSDGELAVVISARSYYRIYVNGKMAASGPARCAHGHCRMDVIKISDTGRLDIAVEVIAIGKPNKYSNDCTLEPGLFTAEICDRDGVVVAATGYDWKYTELLTRRSLVETMSHSRGCVEWYDYSPDSFDWMRGKTEGFKTPKVLEENVGYLERRAPYPSYREYPVQTLSQIADAVPGGAPGSSFSMRISRFMNSSYYELIPKENEFLEKLMGEREETFTGKYTRGIAGEIKVTPGEHPASLMYEIEKSELGFIGLDIEISEECCLDIINDDHLHDTGVLKGNTYVTRYNLAVGNYRLITFEPKLVRYIKLVCRTNGTAIIKNLRVIDYAYPDTRKYTFSCSDGELNEIYEGSRRTLRLNTLDIFMDCPQRERGGWLCDSQFTAQGAWQMFSDLSVEKDFIENFLLTDGDSMWHSFFPEVYPASKESYSSDVGIANWSFWLMTELYDYYRRSGDREFVDKYRNRVVRFVEGLLSLRGESGLLEGMKYQFVDWSLSNKPFCLEPVNIPNNCLAVCVLEKLAELYDMPSWRNEAEEMRGIIEAMETGSTLYGGDGDSASYENGVLKRGCCKTEAGVALELWSGFHKNDRDYILNFVNTMGYAPVLRSNPNVGKANIFIGLIIRFDVLSRLGRTGTLVRELKNLYLPELKEGSGTFFENYNETNGCHGANALVGTLLTNDILGLGQPHQLTKTVRISPHPGALRWARGAAGTSDGDIFFSWVADHEVHELNMKLLLPNGWKSEIVMPFELSGWKVYLNGESLPA